MQLKTLHFSAITLLVSVLCGFSCQSKTDSSIVTIGIIQTASHPALDDAREGFKSELQHLYNGKIKFIEQNAEGNASQAQAIATSFHANKNITAIYAIASLATQAMARVEKTKPIFVAAVTDANALGIMHPKTNVCGSSDKVDATQQLNLLLTLLPQTKHIAILYNPTETNSLVMVKDMTKAISNRNISFSLIGVHTAGEIASTIAITKKNTDVIWTPVDNLVATAMPLITKTALKSGIPVMASDVLLVAQGALLAQGVDYKASGKQTAQIATSVLQGQKKPFELPIANPSNPLVYVNGDVANQLDIKLPESITKNAIITKKSAP